MTLKQFEHEFIAELSPLYDAEEARQLFYMTAEYVSGLSRATIPLHAATIIPVRQEGRYHNILHELKEGRPVQHIFAEAWFYGLKFMVSSSVLIPRPETEELVHWILESAVTRKFSSFLDVGTGSGCIAITLKKKMPASHANALDVSRDALQVAQENASLNGTDINFIQIDILKYSSIDSYDLIVSNPPYITPKERLEMHRNVLAYEPELALFVTEEDPLIFYKSIADFALSHLETSGYLFFEINEYLGKEMIEMMEGKGFINIELRKDMQGKDRMIRCQLK